MASIRQDSKMGMFDDLIPQAPAAAPAAASGNMFADLIPQAAQPAAPKLTPVEGNPFEKAPAAPDETKPFTGLTPNERAKARPKYDREPTATWGDVGNAARNTVEQFGTGANEKLASTIARPIDAASNLLTKPAEWLTGEPNPNPHLVENAVRSNFVDNHPQPQNDRERIARAGGGMAMENLPLSAGGIVAAAKYGPQIGEAVAPAIGGVWNTIKGGVSDYAGAMARKPTTAFVGDTVGAGESGAGGEAFRQNAEDNGGGKYSQFGGEMAGQFGTPAAIAAYTKFGPGGLLRMGASKLTDAVLRHLPEEVLPASLRPAGGSAAERQAEQLSFSNNTGKYAPNEGVNGVPTKDLPVQPPKGPGYVAKRMDQGAQDRADAATNTVAKDFGKITSRPEVQENLTEANRLKAEIPGFEPGVAKATNDPALLNRQQKLESELTNDELRAAQDRTDKSRGAIRTYLDETVPAAAGAPPQDTAARANAARVQNVNDKLENQAQGVRDQIAQRSAALPASDRAAAGQTLREVRHGEQGAADAEVQRLRGAIANPETPIQVGDQTTTVNDALDRRGAINQEIRQRASANVRNFQDVQAIDALNAERDQLDRALDNVNLPGMREYTSYYRDQYAPRFLEGPSRDVGRYSQTGIDKNRVQSEDVPAAFFKPNNISEARQFNRLYGTGNAPETVQARQAMTDYALDDLRHNVVDPNTGVIREGAVNRWAQKNERILNEMPWLRDQVQSHNPDELYARLGQLEQRQRRVADTTAAGLVGQNGEKTIAAALADHTKMRALKASARGDPQVEAALRRAVWEHVLAKGGGEGPLDSAALQQMLQPEAAGGNRRALAEIFDAQHLNRIDNATKATKIENRLDRPTGTYEKPQTIFSKFEDATGTSVPTLGATTSALARGRSSPVYEVPRLIANTWNKLTKREVEAVWKEALSNPKVMEQLQMVGKGGVANPRQIGRMVNYTATLGIHDAKEASGTDK